LKLHVQRGSQTQQQFFVSVEAGDHWFDQLGDFSLLFSLRFALETRGLIGGKRSRATTGPEAGVP
jgi:hypothetical protein